MSDRFFLDTNIYVYSLDRSAPEKARIAADWIRNALTTGNGVISYQVIQEFFNVATGKFAQRMGPFEAENFLQTVFRPMPQVQPSHELFSEALRIKERHSLGWYNSMVVAAAINSGCDRLLTEDLQHGQRFGHLRVQNPFIANPILEA